MTPEKAPMPICLIGASTGGPLVVSSILKELPQTLGAPVIVVQHIGDEFLSGLATWLAQRISLPIELAVDGKLPKPGIVYLPKGGSHLTIDPFGRFAYQPNSAQHAHCPSINILFESVAKNWEGGGVAVLLTGMGEDGATGLKLLREKQFTTVAQNEDTSIVFGMPRAAIRLGAAKLILPPNEIPCIIISKTRKGA